MKKFLSILCVVVLICGLSCGLSGCEQEKGEFRVGLECAYAPFNWTQADDSNGAVPISGTPDYAYGYDIMFAKEVADKLGCELEVVKMEWDALIPALQSGTVDAVIAGQCITAERAAQVDFSDPYAMAQLAILANAQSGIGSIDDLNQAGKKVAVKTGSTGDVFATKNLTNAEIVRLADESACVTEVVQDKADGFLYDQLTIYRNNQKNPDTTEAVFIPFQDPESWGIAVAKGNDELLGQLNEFIAQSKASGEFDRLTEKYLASEKAAFDELGFKWFFDFE